MISLTIKSTKQFMSHLLVKDTFDEFPLSEAEIKTANSFSIDGRINRDFYTKEELENENIPDYSLWSSLKPVCFNLIKGNKVPSFMKIIFMIPDYTCEALFNECSPPFLLENINALYFNIKYSNGTINIITGTNINVFTMDKTLEHALDKYIQNFLLSYGIDFEEIY